MIRELWFRFTAFFRFIFGHDPVVGYFNNIAEAYKLNLEETKITYKEQVAYYEANNQILRQMLDEKNAEIFRLQERLITALSPPQVSVQVSEPAESPFTATSGWDSRRNHLEEINSRKRREEIYTAIAEREKEVAEVLNNQTPG